MSCSEWQAYDAQILSGAQHIKMLTATQESAHQCARYSWRQPLLLPTPILLPKGDSIMKSGWSSVPELNCFGSDQIASPVVRPGNFLCFIRKLLPNHTHSMSARGPTDKAAAKKKHNLPGAEGNLQEKLRCCAGSHSSLMEFPVRNSTIPSPCTAPPEDSGCRY
jgi:hypothetical protein